MKCPVCNVDLLISERQNIEIDYCPQCRGVWLDRGELDKIIERSSTYEPRSQAALTSQMPNDDDRFDREDRPDYHQKKHKRGFLGEIFDVFD